MKRVAALLMSVWLGVQISVGYVVAPILFANLEKMQAGQLAGELFHIVHYLGLFAWGWAFMAVGRTSAWEHGSANKHTRKWIGLLLVLILISEFLFAPTIAALKNNQHHFWSTGLAAHSKRGTVSPASLIYWKRCWVWVFW